MYARREIEKRKDPNIDWGRNMENPNLVEPEIGVGLVGDEVPGPAVRELVRDHLRPGGVPLDHRRGQEHHPRVLHPAVGEARGEHQKVEPFPLVGPEEALPDPDHLLRPGELPSGGVEHVGPALHVDARPRAHVARRDLPGSEGEEVGGDGLVHDEVLDDAVGGAPEGVGAGGGGGLAGEGVAAGEVGGGHDGGEGLGEVEEGGEADAGGGGVVAGEDGAGVDGLALGEDEGVGSGGGEGRGEPLEGGGGGGGGEGEEEGRVAGEGDGERGAEYGVGLVRGDGEGEGERGEREGVGGGGDGEEPGVEEEVAGEGRGEGEQRRPQDGRRREVQVQGQRRRRHQRLRRVRIRMRVYAAHCLSDV